MKTVVTEKQKALNVWAVILIFWSFYRAFFKTELPIWFDEIIMKPLIFVLPVIFFIKKVDKKNVVTVLKLHTHKKIYYILLTVLIFILFFTLHPKYSFILYLIISLFTAFSEEILSRGFVLAKIYEESKNKFFSIIQSSLLSVCLHLPIILTNDVFSGALLIRVLVLDFLLGLIVSILYLEEKSLIPPILVHTLYSLSLYLLV